MSDADSGFKHRDQNPATYIENRAMPKHEIKMSSRYGNAEEMKEMEDFASDIADQGFAHCVSSLFYDSKACICTIEAVGTADELGDEAVAALESAAMRHIGQYQLFGQVGHKGGPERDDVLVFGLNAAGPTATVYLFHVHAESLVNEPVACFESTTPFQAFCIGDKYTPPKSCEHWFSGDMPRVTYITDKVHHVTHVEGYQVHQVSIAVSLTR